jgi:integrase
MRQAEILQLRGADVKTEAGVLFFDLSKSHQLKTKAAVRRVPVHSALMSLGLHKRKGLLWPEWKSSSYLSKRFTVARRRLGLTRPRLSFHSLRGNLVTALDQAGVAQADIAALVGHARGFTFDHYSGGAGLKRLRDIIEKVHY